MLISNLDIPCAKMFSTMNRSKTSLPPGPVARGRMNALGCVIPLYSTRECGVLDLLGDMTLHRQQICRILQKRRFTANSACVNRIISNYGRGVQHVNNSVVFLGTKQPAIAKCCVHVTPFYDTMSYCNDQKRKPGKRQLAMTLGVLGPTIE